MSRPGRRRFFAPEVIQTSLIDCGPASLKCLVEGYGVPISYGRLREACQTDVDGTSIDTLEEIARTLGFDAEQTLVPPDHLFSPSAAALPALLVVERPGGALHFVVAWRSTPFGVQIMDSAVGRGWIGARELQAQLYRHRAELPASQWREWAGGAQFLQPLEERLSTLRVPEGERERLLGDATGDPSWTGLAGLDAATRMTEALVRGGGVRRGKAAAATLGALLASVRDEGFVPSTVPEAYWSAHRAPGADPDEELLQVTGALVVTVRGLSDPAAKEGGTAPDDVDPPPPPSPELVAALSERLPPPGRELWRLLRADGVLRPVAVLAGVALVACGAVLEALLLRNLVGLSQTLRESTHRAVGVAAIVLLVLVLLLAELPTIAEALRMGRRLELRLRMALLKKLPRLPDRYLHSRPISDMAERSHSLHRVRTLPELGRQLLESALQLVVTTAGIAWIDPRSGAFALGLAALSLAFPWLAQPALSERELKVRTHNGALGSTYLDALLGLAPIRAHSAQPAVRSEHESLLTGWLRAGRHLQAGVVALGAAQAVLVYGGVILLLALYLARTHFQGGGALLLLYWALSLPSLGATVVLLLRQYPVHRNVMLRLLEPLLSPDAPGIDAQEHAPGREPDGGVAIELRDVSVKVSGRPVLEEVSLAVAPGSHVAIVGRSGAGKSSLVGLLLGWYRPWSGEVLVEGAPLDAAALEWLRARTAWVDPAVQLWNRSLQDNVTYGAPESERDRVARVIAEADLKDVLENLPEGLSSALGEGGATVSGGEGQRIRLARAMMRWQAPLVVLDEPFRGLERPKRRELLRRTRTLWKRSTLLCITHDVTETVDFPRVLVIEDGRVVEDDAPAVLAARSDSRYRALLEADETATTGLWRSRAWRRLSLARGRLARGEEPERP